MRRVIGVNEEVEEKGKNGETGGEKSIVEERENTWRKDDKEE